MTTLANTRSTVGALLAVEELSSAALLSSLEAHKEKPLIFRYDGRDVRSSYHVTEVKTGSFKGLDCGANPESWSETFIQLWDIEEENRGHMPVGKFLAIIRKVDEAVGFDPQAKLTFEVSDGVRPIQIYRAERMDTGDAAIRVYLSARPSSCKPRDRWLQEQQSCCAPKAKQPCCG
ncbi:DUF6428 family protein [Bradyrhizobium sp. RD5-C2]|uniref:DUF6428 family protein n=1 Tax=Bradyrhizobium sp. RD5-C2 TaxID=244562 RepID=UPI001CC5CF9F|nr:DUF6428 family protein [Bradyrhizobium sp. RD5-C2]GIQ72837.1 hypothetical protein BraRD5C2_12730 [Bradyrhizobium sp. RD5-C2]